MKLPYSIVLDVGKHQFYQFHIVQPNCWSHCFNFFYLSTYSMQQKPYVICGIYIVKESLILKLQGKIFLCCFLLLNVTTVLLLLLKYDHKIVSDC